MIAIIAILAAILFPVFARARENARRASCQSNLKQIGLGLLQYTQDHDERFPGRYNGTEAQSWRRMTFPYIKSTQLFACPSNKDNSESTLDSNPSDPDFVALGLGAPRFGRSYVVNGNSANIGGTALMPANSGQSLWAVSDPTRTVMVTEIGDHSYSEVPMASANLGGDMFTGHLGNVNFLFADGHVKALKPITTGNPINMWNIEENNDGLPSLMTQLSSWDQAMR